MIRPQSTSKLRLRRIALGSAISALTLLVAGTVSAQTTIRQPGQRPHYFVELEPHLLASPFDAPSDPSSGGYGLGLRATFEVAPDGFIPSLNDSVGIGVGLDWVHYAGAGGRGFCRRRESTADGVPVCVETSGQSSSYVFVPLVMQWNFWLHRSWSVFGEPGLALFHRAGGDFGATPVFEAGGRFHFSDSAALTVRLGYPTVSVGVSFLF